MKLLPLPEAVQLARRMFFHIDHFTHYVTGDFWTSVLTDSGSVAVGDAAGGIVTLTPSDGTVADNDEAYIRSTAELFKFAAGKPMGAEALVQFAEANTDDANIIFGFVSGAGANLLLDDGAGPPASYSGAVFFKQDGQTLWSVEKSIGGTQNTIQLTAANSLDGVAKTAGGSSYQRLRIEVYPTSGTKADFLFYIDDVLVAKMTDESIASATEMHLVLGVKNGGANNQTLLADYVIPFAAL